jgi:hypothetical protein
MARNKAESSPGVADVIAEIEQQATRPTRKETQTPASEPSRSLAGRHPEHTNRILSAGASVQQRNESHARLHKEAQSGDYQGRGPDGVRLRLSAQTLGEFTAMALSLNINPTILGNLTVEQTHAARAVLRIANKVERDEAMRVFLIGIKNGSAK